MPKNYNIYASLKENGKEFLLIDFEHPVLDQSGFDKMIEILREYYINEGVEPNFITNYLSIENPLSSDFGAEIDEMETLTTISIYGVLNESEE
jgi:NRPS condensation-like uncharacterized protein